MAPRGGFIDVDGNWAVEATGVAPDIEVRNDPAPVRAGDVTAPEPELIRLPPRIVQPSRLMFRLLRADDDTRDATKEHGPGNVQSLLAGIPAGA